MTQVLNSMFLKRFCLPYDYDLSSFENNSINSNNTSSYECNCINDFYGLNCEYYKSKQFQYSNILIKKQLVDNLLNSEYSALRF